MDIAVPLAAVFDMDGLLVDSEHLWHDVEIRVLGALGVPLDCERCQETKGGFVLDAVRYWHERYPWTNPAPEAVAGAIIEDMARIYRSGALELKPGAVHALDFCRDRGLRLAVASSSPLLLIESALRGLHLADRFDAVCSAESEPAGKPDPAVFLSAAAALGVAPARCVVFEDSPAGVVAARAAGMVCVAVPEGAGAGRNPDGSVSAPFVAADVVLRSLVELDDRVWRTVTDAVDVATPT